MLKKRTWLFDRRNTLGLSTYKVAKKCGISQSFYSGVENGVRDPSVPMAKNIADALGFDWSLFYPDEINKTDSPDPLL